MIADTIDNIELYKNISDIYEGLLFLKNAVPEIETGTYEVSKTVRAIVSTYETIEYFEKGYEAHRNAIDIQYLLKGKEKIGWCPLSMVNCYEVYNEEKDAAFYREAKINNNVTIGSGIFAIFFPHDAHAPQMYIDKPEMVKKIVLKVRV